MPDRVVRSGIITSEAVNTLSWPAEVFFRRLMSAVDDFGRYDGRLSILRSQLYPLQLDKVTESDLGKWLGENQKAGLVRVYLVKNKQFVEIVKFEQRLRAKKSKWPEPEKRGHVSADCGHVLSNASESESESETEASSESEPRNAPTLAIAQAHFAKQREKNKDCDYKAEEVKAAWLSMEAGKDSEGFWTWGKKRAGDWRAALESRIQDNRDRKQQQKPAEGKPLSVKEARWEDSL